MLAINKQGPVDSGYVAGFKGTKVELWARSANAAFQTATEHFRPKKAEKYLVWVELAETNKKYEDEKSVS